MKYLKPLRRLLWPLALYALLLIILITTDPFGSPLLVVMLPFGLLFLALFATFKTLLDSVPQINGLSRQKRLMIAAGAAWLPVMMLILRSIDQLTGRDGLILSVFVIALLLYIGRTSFTSR